MTPAEKILAALAYSPRKFDELRRLTGITRGTLQNTLRELIGADGGVMKLALRVLNTQPMLTQPVAKAASTKE